MDLTATLKDVGAHDNTSVDLSRHPKSSASTSIQGATGDAFSSFKLLGTIEILSDDDGCTLIQDAVLDKTIYLRAKSKSLAATGPNATRADAKEKWMDMHLVAFSLDEDCVNAVGATGTLLVESERELETMIDESPAKILRGVALESVYDKQAEGTAAEPQAEPEMSRRIR